MLTKREEERGVSSGRAKWRAPRFAARLFPVMALT